jgi:hypothetical protein
MDLLVRTARATGMQPDKFAAGMADAMHRISTLLAEKPLPAMPPNRSAPA